MNINELLKLLVAKGGSDLHLVPCLPPAIRVNGELQPQSDIGAISPADLQKILYEILSPEQIQRFESDSSWRNELDFAYGIHDVGRFRFNVHRTRGSVAAVARALSSHIPKLESLGLPPASIRLTEARKGLALVTGPTGSGKSTTLAAIIDRINESRADHILTIEDPIEYLHNSKRSYVTQREVGDPADTLSFKNALKYALRQDPDVILIGEMRDYETIGIAITSAETGHLVFGTLHTSSAAQTVGRIIDVFPSDQQEQVKTQLAGNLFAVMAQILLPKKAGGRVAACELMFCNSAIRNNIRLNNADAIYQAIQTGAGEGMITMDACLVRLVEQGVVAAAAAKPHVRFDTSLRQLEPFMGKDTPAPAAAPATPQPAAGPAESPASPEAKRQRLGSVTIPPWEQGG